MEVNPSETNQIINDTSTDGEFAALLSACRRKIINHLTWYKTYNKEESLEIFQEASIKALQAWREGKFEKGSNFNGWFTIICNNLFIDRSRKVIRDRKHFNRKDHIIANSDGDVTDWLEEKLSCDDDLEATVLLEKEEKEQQLIVQYLIDSIDNEIFKKVVYKRFFERKKFKLIAAEMGMSINTTLGHFRYAAQAMREVYLKRQKYIIAYVQHETREL